NRTRVGIDPYSSPGHSAEDFSIAGNERGRGPPAFRVLPGSSGVWDTATWRNCTRTRPHCDDPGGGGQLAGSDSIPQDRPGGGFDDGCPHSGERSAAEGVGNTAKEVILPNADLPVQLLSH